MGSNTSELVSKLFGKPNGDSFAELAICSEGGTKEEQIKLSRLTEL